MRPFGRFRVSKGRIVALLIAVACGPFVVHAKGEGTEYALRWKSGGPKTADDAVRLLQLAGPQERTEYKVEYFDIGNRPLPGKPIARRRTSDGKVELTLKYRADALPATFDASVACPLEGKVKVKTETDISIDSALAMSPVKSISCEREDKNLIDFPKGLRAVSHGCITRMIRVEVDGFKVEEWQFAKGPVIEVSLSTRKPGGDLKRFQDIVVRLPLTELQIEDRSKSEAGSQCR